MAKVISQLEDKIMPKNALFPVSIITHDILNNIINIVNELNFLHM